MVTKAYFKSAKSKYVMLCITGRHALRIRVNYSAKTLKIKVGLAFH